MTEFEFSKVPPEVQIVGKFDNTCTISVSELPLEALKGWLGSLLDFAPRQRHALLWGEGRRLNRVLNLRNA